MLGGFIASTLRSQRLHRGVAAVLSVTVLVCSVGWCLVPGVRGGQGSPPEAAGEAPEFACAGHACGCRSAAACLEHCCCFPDKSKRSTPPLPDDEPTGLALRSAACAGQWPTDWAGARVHWRAPGLADTGDTIDPAGFDDCPEPTFTSLHAPAVDPFPPRIA